MQQKTVVPATMREKLSTIFYQLNEITQTVRKTAHNLLPDLLLQEGLATALASFCDRLGKTQKKQIDFQEYGHVPAIDKEIELTIYRIVQELVQHISPKTKHDSPLLVQLSCINDLLSFSIEGEGAENAEPAINTLNTEQLQEKISTIKGNLELKSEPGKSVYAYLEFDLKDFIA
jgi:signal transduction histidine kinase